jgi:predicted nucleotidyltransferase component of viral defense system
MFRFTKSDLTRFSNETGFIQNSLEKMLRLIDVLDQIARHPFLRHCFVLKGGTALNAFYFDLPRLSVDADLNYIRSISKRTMHDDRKEIDKIIPDAFGGEYQVTFSKTEYALSQFELRYKTLSGSLDRIKLEINYLHRLPIIAINEIEIDRFGFKCKFPLLGFEELIAGKIIALLSRYTPRDLYDVYLVSISKITIDLDRLRHLVFYYGLIVRDSIFDLFNLKLNTITDHLIRRQLIPMLTGSSYPSFAEMKKAIIIFLEPLIQLHGTQTDSIEKFYTTGEIELEDLFTDPEILVKIKNSPSFLWKKENIQVNLLKRQT